MLELSIGLRRYSAFAAGVVWSALLLQLVLTINASFGNGKSLGYALIFYFGYFTILSNLLVALVLTAAAKPPASTGFWRILQQTWLRVSTTAAIILVGCVYFLILRHTWQPTGLQKLADGMLHYLVPLLYLVYVFVRGALTGMYPYPFIDVPAIGLQQALANAIGILAMFMVLTALLFAFNRYRQISSA